MKKTIGGGFVTLAGSSVLSQIAKTVTTGNTYSDWAGFSLRICTYGILAIQGLGAAKGLEDTMTPTKTNQ